MEESKVRRNYCCRSIYLNYTNIEYLLLNYYFTIQFQKGSFLVGARCCLRDAEFARGQLDRAIHHALVAEKLLCTETTSSAATTIASKRQWLLNLKQLADLYEAKGDVPPALAYCHKALEQVSEAFLTNLSRHREQRVGSDVESFEFHLLRQTVRLTLHSILSAQERLEWERTCLKIDREQRRQVVRVEYDWDFGSLSEISKWIESLVRGKKEGKEELFQLVKWCDPDISSMFELNLEGEKTESPKDEKLV